MRMSQERARLRQWLSEPLPNDVGQALDRLSQTEDVRYVAVMPDSHLAHDVCIGTVLATKRRLYPQAVGGDIGCGMAAIGFECEASLLESETAAGRLLDGLYRTVPVLRHSRATLRESLPDALDQKTLSHPRLEKIKRRDGRVEFATLGRGNHFLEFQSDDEGRLWLMLHSGSRAMGQLIREHHLQSALRANTGLHFLDAESEAGQAYLADVAWALAYAEESRRAMVEAVAELVRKLFEVSADRASLINCHHNHVRHEIHFDEELWVHRKGAISAREGEVGIIPGSMGTLSFHVQGRGLPESLCSSSHGAGRRASRSHARTVVSIGELHRQMKGVWFDHRLAGRLRDEAPSAYKDITAVMRAQRDLTRIVRKLRPILSYKGT